MFPARSPDAELHITSCKETAIGIAVAQVINAHVWTAGKLMGGSRLHAMTTRPDELMQMIANALLQRSGV